MYVHMNVCTSICTYVFCVSGLCILVFVYVLCVCVCLYVLCISSRIHVIWFRNKLMNRIIYGCENEKIYL